MNELAGKVTVVTGGASGLGEGLVRRDCDAGGRREMAMLSGSGVHLGISLLWLLGLVAVEPAGHAQAQEIHWYKDLNQAVSYASESNKPMMLDFWADWCVACTVMEKEVYTEPAVIEAASTRFLPVQIDFDRRPELARKYRVEGLPTLLFTDSRGEELFRYVGVLDAATLTELLKALPADVSEINRLRESLERDKNNFEVLAGLGDQMRIIGLWRMSNQYYERALKQDRAKKALPERERLMKEPPPSLPPPLWRDLLAYAAFRELPGPDKLAAVHEEAGALAAAWSALTYRLRPYDVALSFHLWLWVSGSLLALATAGVVVRGIVRGRK